MKTITFYSYKGGVGRTLALANVATQLSKYGKKVCIIDFDLEAPGLHHKFEKELEKKFDFKSGLIDYISHFTKQGEIPDELKSYTQEIKFPENQKMPPITFFPAGNVYKNSYWKNLRDLDLKQFMQQENKEGILFFLDFKQKIEDEIKPDYLLIDSRTGITEIFGISTSLLADKVVVVSANNEENYLGSEMIIKSITNKENNFKGEVPGLVFVISRLPLPENATEEISEKDLITDTVSRINSKSLTKNNLVIIHSDRKLEIKETIKIGLSDNNPITRDYIRLFHTLFDEDLTELDRKKYNQDVAAEDKFKYAYNHKDDSEKIKIYKEVIDLKNDYHQAYNNLGVAYAKLNNNALAVIEYSNAISLMPDVLLYYLNRGIANINLNLNEDAINDFNKALELDPKNYNALFNLASIYTVINQTELGIKYYQKLVDIAPDSEDALFQLAQLYYNVKDYEKSIEIINKILKINPENLEALFNLGNVYYSLKDLTNTFKYFHKILEIDYKFAKAHYRLGQIYSQTYNLKLAVDSFNKAIELGHNLYYSYTSLGMVYGKLKNQSLAVQNVKKAIKLNPLNYFAWGRLGRIYINFRNIPLANKNFKNAFKLEKNRNTYANLGLIYGIKKEFETAIIYYTKSLSLFEKSDDFYRNLLKEFDIYSEFGITKIEFEKQIVSQIKGQ